MTMRTHLDHAAASPLASIPLLDASSLPSSDDWAVLESIHADADGWTDFEPDSDRFGNIRLSAFYDE
jgi:hypothetical protein